MILLMTIALAIGILLCATLLITTIAIMGALDYFAIMGDDLWNIVVDKTKSK